MKTNVMILPAQNGFSGDGFVKREGTGLTVCLRGESEGEVWWCTKDEAHELTERRGGVRLYRGPAESGMPAGGAVIALRGQQAVCLLGIGDHRRLTEDFAKKRGLTAAKPSPVRAAAPVDALSAAAFPSMENREETAENATPNAISPESAEAVPEPIPQESAAEAEPEPIPPKSAADAVPEPIPQESAAEAVPEPIPQEIVNPTKAEEPVPAVVWAPPEPLTPPASFWECNAAAMEQLFLEHPAEEELAMLIPGSRWAQVENDGAPYIVGTIYDDDREPLFLCYGFPMPWSENPPEALEGYSQWVPKDFSHPRDDGYWMIYVNARTGERVL